jgi:hypothetical protein
VSPLGRTGPTNFYIPDLTGDGKSRRWWCLDIREGHYCSFIRVRSWGLRHLIRHRKPMDRPFNENDWSDLQSDLAPYQRSTTFAELAAWDFIKNEGNGLEMAAVNPTAVLGPALGAGAARSDQNPSIPP